MCHPEGAECAALLDSLKTPRTSEDSCLAGKSPVQSLTFWLHSLHLSDHFNPTINSCVAMYSESTLCYLTLYMITATEG